MYEPSAGDSVTDTCEVMAAIASETEESVTACFNGIELCANPGVSPQSIVEFYTNECERLYRIYLAVADAEQKWSSRGLPSLAEGALSASPEHLTLKNEDAWTESVETNKDRYGDAVISYAERWARLMEGRIAHGGTVDGCAEETSRIADCEHITAFMYDCAASILSQSWIHGEELNKWHNLNTQ